MKKKPSHPLSKHVRVALPVFILMAIAGVYLLVTPFGIAWGGKPVSGGATSAAISNVKSANITFASAAFTFDTDVPALGKVCYSTDSRLRTYTCRFDIVGTPHTVLADFLSPNTTYYYDAEASVGTITTKSPIQSFKTLPSPSPADKTAPSESITTPVAGSTVSGVIPVNVTAQDAGGITQVEIVLDIVIFYARIPSETNKA